MLKSILLSILDCFACIVHAQNRMDTINILKHNQIFIGGRYFVCNDTIYQYSFYSLRSKLKTNFQAVSEYDRAESIQGLEAITGLLGFACIGGGLVALINKSNASGQIFTASLGSFLLSLHFYNSSKSI